MSNAKEEFLNHTEGKPRVKCAIIDNKDWDDKSKVRAELKNGYSDKDLELFLALINFRYDSGYGGQELYGTIWYEDGTWSNRGEYDGSEWWEYQSMPEIPEALA